nr:MAG TPA: Mediator of RNA polymerase II [Caudoviricetes sp.]
MNSNPLPVPPPRYKRFTDNIAHINLRFFVPTPETEAVFIFRVALCTRCQSHQQKKQAKCHQ